MRNTHGISHPDVFFHSLVCILFLNLHASRTYMGSKYDLSAGLTELLKLSEEGIELHRALERDFHDHGELPGHAAAF